MTTAAALTLDAALLPDWLALTLIVLLLLFVAGCLGSIIYEVGRAIRNWWEFH